MFFFCGLTADGELLGRENYDLGLYYENAVTLYLGHTVISMSIDVHH